MAMMIFSIIKPLTIITTLFDVILYKMVHIKPIKNSNDDKILFANDMIMLNLENKEVQYKIRKDIEAISNKNF